MTALRICLAASEMAPFAKTGGLGDVCGSLVTYLTKHGHDVRAFLPLYGRIDASALMPVGFVRDVPVELGGRTFTFSLRAGRHGGPGGPLVYFVDCPALFGGRDEIYSQQGDEHLRFAMLSRAALESCQRMGFAPDIVHAHDWHTALMPLYVRTLYSWDRLFARTRSVLTLHNLAYQGAFPFARAAETGLGPVAHMLHQDEARAGRFSFLTTGLLWADALTVVSPTHAREVQTPEHGFGLDALLRARGVVGILNGIDHDVWDPSRDAHLPARYSPNDLSGKAVCRAELLRETGLAPTPGGPVFGVVSRLTAQKGFELFQEALLPVLASRDVRIVCLGSGSREIAGMLGDMARAFPRKFAFREGYDERMAHRIEAGADAFLMPSLFEPCGLNQMYSLRYGTVPIVRKTGGLADTVRLYDRRTGDGTGIVFDHFTAQGLRWAAETAVRLFADRAVWRSIQLQGMAEDNGWDRRIGEYESLYRRLAAG
ncbi:MAG: Glycogen synthase [Planctomycetes bacterium]|nr:Glycogen synthase [Planctomycetota bacterium]